MNNVEKNMVRLINLLSNNISRLSVDQLDDKHEYTQNASSQNNINNSVDVNLEWLIEMSADLLYAQSMIELTFGLDFTE